MFESVLWAYHSPPWQLLCMACAWAEEILRLLWWWRSFGKNVRIRRLIQRCFIDEQMSSWWRYIHSSFIQIVKMFTCIRRDRAEEGLVCKQSIDLRYSYMFCNLPFFCVDMILFFLHTENAWTVEPITKEQTYTGIRKLCLKGSILQFVIFGWRHGI